MSNRIILARNPRISKDLYGPFKAVAKSERARLDDIPVPAKGRLAYPGQWHESIAGYQANLSTSERPAKEVRTLVAHGMGVTLARGLFDRDLVDRWMIVSPSVVSSEGAGTYEAMDDAGRESYGRLRAGDTVRFDRATLVSHAEAIEAATQMPGIIVVGSEGLECNTQWARTLAERTGARLVEFDGANDPMVDFPRSLAHIALGGSGAIRAISNAYGGYYPDGQTKVLA